MDVKLCSLKSSGSACAQAVSHTATLWEGARQGSVSYGCCFPVLFISPTYFPTRPVTQNKLDQHKPGSRSSAQSLLRMYPSRAVSFPRLFSSILRDGTRSQSLLPAPWLRSSQLDELLKTDLSSGRHSSSLCGFIQQSSWYSSSRATGP